MHVWKVNVLNALPHAVRLSFSKDCILAKPRLAVIQTMCGFNDLLQMKTATDPTPINVKLRNSIKPTLPYSDPTNHLNTIQTNAKVYFKIDQQRSVHQSYQQRIQ